jgi:NAD(P)-dependent dehydrogenase (short-subunit alcohol dehydrogenase family)
MSRLEDRVAIVTGAAQGIGYAIASRLIDEGARRRRVRSRRRPHARRRRIASTRRASARDRRARATCRRRRTAVALVDAAVEAFGAVDILVNNAGVTHAAEFLDLDEADFDRVLAINLKSMFLCGQAVARRMVAQGKGGAIVNLSSVNAVLAIPNQVPYCVSKGGVAQLTKVMALSLASHGIRVNAIGPGTIATEMAKKAVLGSEEAKRKILSRTPMGRLGEPEEIASVAAFLASDDASYLTGQTIYPDGGRLGLNYTVPVA